MSLLRLFYADSSNYIHSDICYACKIFLEFLRIQFLSFGVDSDKQKDKGLAFTCTVVLHVLKDSSVLYLRVERYTNY